MIEMWALCGLVLAGASVISNDAVQTLGTFMASNKQTSWWKLWGAASAVLVSTVLYSWFAYNGDLASIKENGIYWFAGNFIGAALFCLLAGGHPIAILVAALASPITSLNPALAAGWFAGYAQMKVKEPTGEVLTEFL